MKDQIYGIQRGLSPADFFFCFPLRDVSYHVRAAPGVRAVLGIGAPRCALCCAWRLQWRQKLAKTGQLYLSGCVPVCLPVF